MEKRIPSLDGFRAISITLVMLLHASGQYRIPGLWRVDIGKLGVQIFFVISGFLITGLLLKEERREGRINVPAFYARRAFRIMPAYYAFLLVMVLLVPTGWVHATYRNFLPAVAYFADYSFPGRTLAHTWSLAVEEQFYLLWPGALLLFGVRRSLYGCVLLILIAPVARVVELSHGWFAYPFQTFECVCDALACGCALAIMRDRLWVNSIYRACVSSRYLFCVPLAVVVLTALGPGSPVMMSARYSAFSIAIAMVLDRYMRFPTADVGGLLNWKPVVWIGTLSYSLYLWQQPLMYAFQFPFLARVAAALSCAAVSYYLIERPFLALRERLRIASAQKQSISAEAPSSSITPV